MKRREFLTLPAAAIGGTLLYTLAGEPIRLQAQNGTVKVPLRFFTAEEAKVITAASARIFPSDASGPGATEANVVIYIDRQLAGPTAATSTATPRDRGSSPIRNTATRTKQVPARPTAKVSRR